MYKVWIKRERARKQISAMGTWHIREGRKIKNTDITILRENTYMVRNTIICKKLKLPSSDDAIYQASSKFIHKIMRSKKPSQIYKRLDIPRRPRGIFKLRPKTIPKTKRLERTLFNSSIEIYNRIPEPIRSLEFPQFRRRIKEFKWNDLQRK